MKAIGFHDFGGPDVLRGQLAHLATLAQRRHIEIRILPEAVNLTARIFGAFWVFKLPGTLPEVAYLENLAGRMYLESPRSVRFVYAYDRLREVALSAEESAEMITLAAKELA